MYTPKPLQKVKHFWKPNVFLAGCQKSGSTWLYRCFAEHPDIFVPEKDSLHFFNINHHRGEQWYHLYYNNVYREKAIVDPTPSYIRFTASAERIYQFNPNAKLIFVIRNPIDRAFSHYWHQKRKRKLSFKFIDALYYNDVGNYDLFESWLASGCYARLLQPYLAIFPREQIHLELFDDLEADPSAYLRRVFSFMGVEPDFQPSVLRKRINVGAEVFKPGAWRRFLVRLGLSGSVSIDEYSAGIPEKLREELRIYYAPHNLELSKLIGRDLSHWG